MLPFANYNISSPSMRDQNNNSNNSNKRRRKRRPATVISGGGGGGGGGDDLAVVKAAAWAWYQRNEGKPMMREFDVPRANSRIAPPRPTRYKLEATKNMILSENRVLAENRVSKSSLWYNNVHDDNKTLFSHLLDTYEIESISKRIDDLLPDSFPISPTSSMFHHDDHDHDHNHDHGHDHDHGFVGGKISYGQSNNNSNNVNGFVKKVNKRKLWEKFMLMGPATVCGRSDDVASRRTGKVAAAAAAVALVKAAARGK